MKHHRSLKSIAVVGAVVAGSAVPAPAEAAPRVLLNGQPLATTAAPVIVNGRTLVPMRDIFEALNATVVWNGATQEIRAQSDNRSIALQIGARTAVLNGQHVALDQPPLLFRGSTFVPLRFVSEALGTQVSWNSAGEEVRIVSLPRPVLASEFYTPTQTVPTSGQVTVMPPVIVSPATDLTAQPAAGLPLPAQPVPAQPEPEWGQAVAGVRTISIPEGAVVPVTLDRTISSADAHVGDRFTATVASQRLGDSEFPAGTKLEGIVVESRPRTKENPGVLDFDFRAATLPDGTHYNLRGELISLDSDSVTMTAGRVMARESNNRNKNDRIKIVGIGAAAGFVLGKVLDTNTTISTVLGAAGGYLYTRSRDKNRVANAVVTQGAQLGVRLKDPVGYTDTTGYADYRLAYLHNQ
jgi:hypothetical protein